VCAGLELPPKTDDDHSPGRGARDRYITGAVREAVQLEGGVEVRQRCFQRQSISRGRAIQCLPTFARMTGSKRRQHTQRAPRSEHGSNSHRPPRRADAISKAGVRRLDTGRVVRHGFSCLAAAGGRLLRPGDAQAGSVVPAATAALLLLYGIGRSLAPRSDRPGSTVRVIAMREKQWPASWSRSPLLGHDCDGWLRQARGDRMATRRSWGWSPSVPPRALPFAQDRAPPATCDTPDAEQPARTRSPGAALGSVDSAGMAAFPDGVVKGVVRLVCRPFGPGATRPS
jgi:hypothetical protein